MKQATFEVAGMSCGSCVRHVTQTLQRIDGVTVQSVEVGSADVSFDPAKVSPETIATALAADGYPAMLRAGGNSVATTSDADKTGKPGGCCCHQWTAKVQMVIEVQPPRLPAGGTPAPQSPECRVAVH